MRRYIYMYMKQTLCGEGIYYVNRIYRLDVLNKWNIEI
jgi:hypothetical protein